MRDVLPPWARKSPGARRVKIPGHLSCTAHRTKKRPDSKDSESTSAGVFFMGTIRFSPLAPNVSIEPK